MMPNRNRPSLALMSGMLGLILLTGCGAASGGDELASVNGEKLSRAEYLTKLESTQQAKSILNQMVQSALVEQYAKNQNIQIPDKDVRKKEDEIKARYPAGQFDTILKQQNLTDNDVKRILRQQLIVEKGVGKDIHISKADITSYLAKNHTLLDKAAQVRARHILVADTKTAADVEAKLKTGAKFDALAKEYSTDPSSKDKGGELGFFSKGQMVPSFEAAAFSQPIGVVGPPVKSPFGYHIIEVEEKKPATVATTANSGDQIKETLMHQQEQTLIPQFLQGLRTKAAITIDDPLLKDALPPLAPPTAATTGAPPTTSTATTSATTAATAKP